MIQLSGVGGERARRLLRARSEKASHASGKHSPRHRPMHAGNPGAFLRGKHILKHLSACAAEDANAITNKALPTVPYKESIPYICAVKLFRENNAT